MTSISSNSAGACQLGGLTCAGSADRMELRMQTRTSSMLAVEAVQASCEQGAPVSSRSAL